MSSSSPKKIVAASVIELQQAFLDSALLATVTGHARTWWMPYLQAVLENFLALRQHRVGGQRVSLTLDPKRIGAIQKLIKNSSNRDRRTRSRWAAAVHAAHRAGIDPAELPRWLAEGGGISGRARNTKPPKHALNVTGGLDDVDCPVPTCPRQRRARRRPHRQRPVPSVVRILLADEQ
jgi:hypothetical protein